ncbi:unnamed protein product [Ixodes hexagonus]
MFLFLSAPQVCVKEGSLLKQTSSFQRWKKRYFRLKPRKLYYAKDSKSVIFEEIDLTELSVAECSTKNANHSFQIITPFRRLILCAETRKEMEDWISALKSVCNKDFYEGTEHQQDFLSGQHNWYVTSHARPTYCNVCKEALSGVTSHGLSCEVCKFKAHKRCAVKSPSNCKWTTLASVGKDIIEDEDGSLTMPHQWMEGNLPVSAKCNVCDRTCGSVLRLQDWRCLWCRATTHAACRSQHPVQCPLGVCRTSIVPPTALHSTGVGSEEPWEAVLPARRNSGGGNQGSAQSGQQQQQAGAVGSTPLLVFVNSKSGNNQGVRFIRRFKQLLNPAQVFDLMNGGPGLGLRMFRAFVPLRVLVCAGDGSVSWVLSEMDRLELHRQCQTGVLPLGTGNDLARVLGWGSVCDDDAQLPQLLDKYARATPRLLDRWSIMTYEGTMPQPSRKLSTPFDAISVYEDSVVAHLSQILHSDQHSVVISSAKVLCETVKDFIAKVGAADMRGRAEEDKDSISHKCKVLNEKLDSLLKTLKEESLATEQAETKETRSTGMRSNAAKDAGTEKGDPKAGSVKASKATFIQKEALMLRANSLKKAVRQIIEHTERAVDEQNAQTKVREEQSEEERSISEQRNMEEDFSFWPGDLDQCTTAVAEQQQGPGPMMVTVTEPPEEQPETEQLAQPSDQRQLSLLTASLHEAESTGQCWDPWGIAMGQSVGAPLKDTLQVTLATIEGGLSADSSPCPSPRSMVLSPSPTPSPCSPSPLPDTPRQTPSPVPPRSLALTPTTEDDDEERSWNPPKPPPRKHKGRRGRRKSASEGGPAARTRSRRPSGIGSRHRSQPAQGPPHLTEPGQETEGARAATAHQPGFRRPNTEVSCPALPFKMEGRSLIRNFTRGLNHGTKKLMVLFRFALRLVPARDLQTCLLPASLLYLRAYYATRSWAKITLKVHNEKRATNLPFVLYPSRRDSCETTYSNCLSCIKICYGQRLIKTVTIRYSIQYSTFFSRFDSIFDSKTSIRAPVSSFPTLHLCTRRSASAPASSFPASLRCTRRSSCNEGASRHHAKSDIQQNKKLCCLALLTTEVPADPRSAFADPLGSADPHLKTTRQLAYHFDHATCFMLSWRSMCQICCIVCSIVCLASDCCLLGIVCWVSDRRTTFSSPLRRCLTCPEQKLRPDLEDKLVSGTNALEEELRKCFDLQGPTGDDEHEHKRPRGLFKLKFKRSKTTPPAGQPMKTEPSSSISSSGGGTTDDGSGGLLPQCRGGGSRCGTPTAVSPSVEESPDRRAAITRWTAEEVASWLAEIHMREYQENFLRHDIRGAELLSLERRDLKELGLTKVGHIKRILQAITDMRLSSASSGAHTNSTAKK